MKNDEPNTIAVLLISVFLGLFISHFLNKIDALNTKMDEILKTIRERGGGEQR